jgi:uncharacterized protein (TIGR02679 family)
VAPDVARIRAFFAPPALHWILDRLVERISCGRTLTGVISRGDASLEERRAVDDLLGRRSTAGKQLNLNLAELEHILRLACVAECLEDAVAACRGPVENRRAKSERRREEWSALFDYARSCCRDREGLLIWMDSLMRDGSLKRLARGDVETASKLMQNALRVVSRDPNKEVLLANLAAECADDSHALDRGQPLAALCLRAIAALHGIDGQRSADARRKAWAAIGVIIDDLSAPVLVFNLRASAGSALEPFLDLHRQKGQPAFLSYRQLQVENSFLPLDSAARVVYICENPSVVSAAAREIGSRCQPLVCTNGQPASAARLLLSQLHQAGAELRCHADFDWAGLRIADQLMREYAVIPWRMSAAAYNQAEGSSVSLDPQTFNAAWSTELVQALRSRSKAVFEEQVMRSLLDDLGKELLTETGFRNIPQG